VNTQDRWHFMGDVNLEYGGNFIDLANFRHGYAEGVRVTDLDGGCGFTGAVMVEHVIICGTTDRERVKEALRSCGSDYMRERGKTREQVQWMIAEALLSYGHYDPDDCWDSYQSHHTEILQMEADGPMTFDGWKADKRLHNTTLEDYVRSVHLRD
jgi:hypothetical protein